MKWLASKEEKIVFHPVSLTQTWKRGRNELTIKISFVLIMWGYTHRQLENWIKNFEIGALVSYYITCALQTTSMWRIIYPIFHSWKWLQRYLTNCRAKTLLLLSLQPPSAPLGKTKMHQKTPPSSQRPSQHMAWVLSTLPLWWHS